ARQAQRTVQEFLSDPKTQQRVHETASTVTDTIKEKSPALGGVAEKAADLLDKTTGYDSDETLGHANSPTADPENDKAGHKTVNANGDVIRDRKSTRLNSSHVSISYAVFCLKKKNT